ncbi:MAG: hypothetical protein RIR65_507, partial [Planctomycetota bacterium]
MPAAKRRTPHARPDAGRRALEWARAAKASGS